MLTVKQPQQSQKRTNDHSGSRAVKQYRKRDALVGKGAAGNNLLGDKQATVQPKMTFHGFPVYDQYFKLLKNVLENVDNKYSRFFKTDFCDLRIILDPTKDENPGDACSYIQKPGKEKLDYADLGYIRDGGKIEKLMVRINIRKWFYDSYDAGKILSMIAHEVAVHVLPYMDEYLAAFTNEIQEKIGFDEPGEIDRTKTHGPSGINDHRRVADPDHEDFFTYRSYVNQMANAVLSDDSQLMKQHELQLTAEQLTDAYLMDIATFTGSGRRLKYPLNPNAVALKYNNYLSDKPKLKLLPKKKKGKDVTAAYNDLYKKALPIALVNHKKKAGVLLLLMLGLIYYFIRLFI